MTYKPNATLDTMAWDYAGLTRDVMIEGRGKVYEAYVKYARGDETTEKLHGYEEWRLAKLRRLKKNMTRTGSSTSLLLSFEQSVLEKERRTLTR
jgi:hypothetical protein